MKLERINQKTKLTLYCSIVELTLLYGFECWALTKTLEKRLQVFQRKCLRSILSVFIQPFLQGRASLAQLVKSLPSDHKSPARFPALPRFRYLTESETLIYLTQKLEISADSEDHLAHKKN